MAHEKVAARIQAMPKLLDQALLLGFVKIDHDVAAENDVVAPRQKFGFEIVEVELHEVLQLWLDGIFITGFFKVTQAAGVIDRLHLLLGEDAFLADAKAGVTDVRGDDFEFPRRRNQRLGRRHIERKRIAQIVVGQSVADQDGDGIRFLAAGTAGTPDAKIPVAAFLLLAQQILQNAFLQEIELRFLSEEARFVDGEVFQQQCQLSAAFAASQQTVVAIERVELTNLESALEAVFQEMRAALVEKHAAFLIDECLQQLQFSFRKLNLGG